MPEGDTILRAARTLRRALAGKVVTRFSSNKLPGARLAGRTVASVEAKGKHLLVTFDDGRVLHTHMRMSGSWHLYRTGEPWQRGEHRARCVIEVADPGGATEGGFVAVLFDAPTVRLLQPSEPARDPTLAQLGPDVLGATLDVVEAVRRLRTLDDREIGDALLDQRALAGVGNIYKSESLFLCCVDPRARVADLDDATLVRIVEQARRIMREAVPDPTRRAAAPRTRTRPWVYGRAGQSCRRCAERIVVVRQSAIARSTYFCPRCQRLGRQARASSSVPACWGRSR
jgi:endonuclease-8